MHIGVHVLCFASVEGLVRITETGTRGGGVPVLLSSGYPAGLDAMGRILVALSAPGGSRTMPPPVPRFCTGLRVSAGGLF